MIFKNLEECRTIILRDVCDCGYKGLSGLPLESWGHSGGYEVNGVKVWPYVVCPKCGYEWSVVKLSHAGWSKELMKAVN